MFLQAEGRGGAEEAAGGERETAESCTAGRGGESEAGGGEEEQGGRGETAEGAEMEGHAGSAGQRGQVAQMSFCSCSEVLSAYMKTFIRELTCGCVIWIHRNDFSINNIHCLADQDFN